MSLFDDPTETLLRITGAERIESSILGVTLCFTDGHRVALDYDAIEAARALIFREERKALDQLKEETRLRT